MTQKLINARAAIRSKYGSYLATEVFRRERELCQRITAVLNNRYKIL